MPQGNFMGDDDDVSIVPTHTQPNKQTEENQLFFFPSQLICL
jgi:hypothetical protein